jgi:toxin CcdB
VARFDPYKLGGSEQYVVDVQSDHASKKLRTRVVAPLTPVDDLGPLISDLNPVVRIGSRDYAFVAQSLATLTKRELGDYVGSLMHHYDELSRALDILLTGF